MNQKFSFYQNYLDSCVTSLKNYVLYYNNSLKIISWTFQSSVIFTKITLLNFIIA